jgi:phage shock protein A
MGFLDGIFNRLWVKGKALEASTHDVVADATVNEARAEQRINELERDLARLRTEVRVMEKDAGDRQKDVDDLMAAAKKALGAGDEGNARAALEAKKPIESQLAGLNTSLAANKKATDQLKTELQGWRDRLAQAKVKHTELEARLRTANLQAAAKKTAAQGGDDPLAKLGDFEKAVVHAESAAEVATEMSDEATPTAAKILAEVRAAPSTSVDDDLAALKASMGSTGTKRGGGGKVGK